MSAEFESGVLANREAWHGLGAVLTSEELSTMTLDAIVAKAFPGPVEGMSWKVATAPITASAFGTTYDVDGQIAVVRDIAPHVVGIHSDAYSARQLYDNAELIRNATDGAPWESMFSLRDGRRTVFLVKLGEDVMVGGIDQVNMFAMLADSYDGSLALTAGTTGVRVVCTNTLNMALPGMEARPHVKIKHTKNMNVKVSTIRDALAISYRWAEGFAATADKLINEPVSLSDFESIIRQAFPKTSSDPAPFSREQYGLIGVLQASPTISDDIRYTGWGAVNAVSEFLEWGKARRNTTGTDDALASARATAERRLEDSLLSDQRELSKVAALILA